MFDDRGMNGIVGPAGMLNQFSWQPEHAPKVATLTQTLDEALKILRDVAARLDSSVSKLSPIPMAQAKEGQAGSGVERPTYPPGEAAAEVRRLAERLKKLAMELDERL